MADIIDYVTTPDSVKILGFRCTRCGRFCPKRSPIGCHRCGTADLQMRMCAYVKKPLENVEISFIMDPKNPDHPFSDVKVTQL